LNQSNQIRNVTKATHAVWTINDAIERLDGLLAMALASRKTQNAEGRKRDGRCRQRLGALRYAIRRCDAHAAEMGKKASKLPARCTLECRSARS